VKSPQLGFTTIFGRTFATNYPKEYEQIGQDDVLRKLAIASGGLQLELLELSELNLVTESQEKMIPALQPIYRYLFIALLILMLIHMIILRGLRK
jgi:hypothetical protein